MNTNTQKKKHQQFGFQLLVILLLVAVIFSIWYFSEKQDRHNEILNQENISRSAPIPADDLKDLREIYLNSAKDLMKNGYGNLQLANNFHFQTRLSDQKTLSDMDTTVFWSEFGNQFGYIDQNSAQYLIQGNQVKISFESDKSGNRYRFWRLVSFGNYDKQGRTSLKPVLEEEAVIQSDSATQNQDKLAVVGSYLNQLFQPEELMMKGVEDGKIVDIDLGAEVKKHWTMLFFFDGAYTPNCPSDCVNLLDSIYKLEGLNLKVYAIGADLPTAQTAWSKSYFGKLPVSLLADTGLTVTGRLGFADYSNWAPRKGVMILDNTGKIRYLSMMDKMLTRNYDDYVRIIKLLQAPEIKLNP
jgi:alkyl hydroperoxide reductase subunit AhpC